MDYKTAKQLVSSTNMEDRLRVAEADGIKPELLYFLANDTEAQVRQRIAANKQTPRQADLALSRDADPQVRSALADKVSQLVPTLGGEAQTQITELTHKVLDVLARDQALRVREVLAETLKAMPEAPPDVIHKLARDVELSVCGPVLERSPILTDNDLLAIMGDGPVAGALSAIARREMVSEPVVDAIAATDDVAAVAALLGNPSAQIREATLDQIIERAPDNEPWHEPLVRRPALPQRAVRRLATFVADNLVKELSERTDLDPGVGDYLAETVRRRIAGEPLNPDWNAGDDGDPAGGGKAMAPARSGGGIVDDGDDEDEDEDEDEKGGGWFGLGFGKKKKKKKADGKGDDDDAKASGKKDGKKQAAKEESPLEYAVRLAKEKKLTEKVVALAVEDLDRPFVGAALSQLSRIPLATVEQIINSQNGRAVMAVCWRAKISARLGREVQLKIARIVSTQVVNPRAGNEYPDEDGMAFQLELFGVDVS